MALEDTAKRLIKKNGRSIAIRRTVRVPADPNQPWAEDTETVTEVSTFGVFIDENAKDLEARLSAVSRLVLAPVEVNGVQVYIAGKGLPFPPTIDMEIVDGNEGRVLAIKKVGTIKPGTVPFLYICKVEN